MKFLPTLLSFLLCCTITVSSAPSSSGVQLIIRRGFSASPSSFSSSSSFQPILNDHSGAFAFGFLQVGSNQLDLSVIHLPSSEPLWRAIPARPATWGDSTSLSFNGSLVLSDPDHGVFWSTDSIGGDNLVLLNSSNLQIQKLGNPFSVLWQSFDFPSNTIVQGQNFTSRASLFSDNGKFSMNLGLNYLALRMDFASGLAPIYWKHTALEAKAQIIPGKGPIYARVDPVGFLGMYQNEKAPVDVLSFDTFNRGITGFRRLTLESDGNLKAYYWNGSVWVLDFQAITAACELPSACGAYGLCQSGEPQCSCLDNSTEECPPADSGSLCSQGEDEYWVLRRKGVELPNKELIGYQKMATLEECERSCEHNCSCWGAVYNNATGFCYRIDYPVQTLLEVADQRKMGYFKVRTVNEGGGGKGKVRLALLVVGVAVVLAGAGLGFYRMWNQRKRKGDVGGAMAAGPYKDLNSGSFRSIEMSESFRK